MLRTRILTAAVIAPAALVVVFLLPQPAFRLAIALLLMIGCLEYTRLAALGRIAQILVLLAQLAIFSGLLVYWGGIGSHGLAFMTAGCLCWCLMFLRLLTFRPGHSPGINYRFLTAFSALASLTFAAYALFWLRGEPHGSWLVLLLLLVIWAADIGAYFTGRRFGHHRLAPHISPGKTREGLLGGLLAAVLVAILFSRAGPVLPGTSTLIALVTAITVLASAGGDLFVSIHKRTTGLKDSGRLFPGHGGVLDRFDSLLAGAPFFALGAFLLGRLPA